MQKTALKTSGFIFLLVALLHLLRLIFKLKVMIGGFAVPFWVSVLGLVIPMALAAWMFKASK